MTNTECLDEMGSPAKKACHSKKQKLEKKKNMNAVGGAKVRGGQREELGKS